MSKTKRDTWLEFHGEPTSSFHTPTARAAAISLACDGCFSEPAPEPTGQQLAGMVKDLFALANAELSVEAARK